MGHKNKMCKAFSKALGRARTADTGIVNHPLNHLGLSTFIICMSQIINIEWEYFNPLSGFNEWSHICLSHWLPLLWHFPPSLLHGFLHVDLHELLLFHSFPTLDVPCLKWVPTSAWGCMDLERGRPECRFALEPSNYGSSCGVLRSLTGSIGRYGGHLNQRVPLQYCETRNLSSPALVVDVQKVGKGLKAWVGDGA
ncbi:hypothetical protein VNO77_19672 [Canavalia gladiata]|uniref:Uncharacterized protein n=1 Tax=Canavalia gladiata TaxID=3824 RepID=A0AAN9QKQ5_CANGL